MAESNFKEILTTSNSNFPTIENKASTCKIFEWNLKEVKPWFNR